MAGLITETISTPSVMTEMTQSQRHWKAWLTALQTRDANLRAAALEQLSKFLDYWTKELYGPSFPMLRGLSSTSAREGHDTPQESWDEVFEVEDPELVVRPRRETIVRFDSNEAWVGPYGLDETTIEVHHIDKNKNEKPFTLNPWDNDDGSKETKETLSRYYCGIQRLVVDCPFADVRRICRKLLDKAKRKHVEIPTLVHDGPSWLIPLTEIISLKTDKRYTEIISPSLQIPERYISDESSSDSDSDIEFSTRRPSDSDDLSVAGYSYYTSPETTPRPTFTTPAIPINAPPRTRSRTIALSRNTSTDSIAQSTTSNRSRKSSSSHRRQFPHQPHASPDLHEFHVASFLAHGRVTNYARVLSYSLRYIRCSSTCYEKLISSAKGISRPVKTYIALLAAAEMGCQYFVSYFTAKFLELGGDTSWVKGITHTNGKIRRITALNRKMLERPWELSRMDIIRLGESDKTADGEEMGWTSGEIAQIMTILAMFQAQSAIALGMGVVCEADVYGGTVWRHISKAFAALSLEDEEVDEPMRRNATLSNGTRSFRGELLDRLQMRMISSGHMSPDMSFDNLEKLAQRDELRIRQQKNFLRDAIREWRPSLTENVPQGVALPASLPVWPSSAKTPTPAKPDLEQPVNPVIEDLTRFVADHINAVPIAIPSSQPILSTTKYSWDDALQIMHIHLSDVASNLDRRFHLPPTSHFLQTQGWERVDIYPFVEALRNYSLGLIGIMSDTYDYRQLNEYLNDALRQFIRRISLDPRGILKSDWEALRKSGFSNSEIVEIGVIVCEARFMGVLLYAFRIIGDI